MVSIEGVVTFVTDSARVSKSSGDISKGSLQGSGKGKFIVHRPPRGQERRLTFRHENT